MSKWQDVPKEEIEIDGEDINICLEGDNFGNNYCVVKKADMLELLSPGWISVKDRLPEDGQVVAFIIDKSVNYYGGSMCAGRFRYFDYGDIKLPKFGTWGYGGLTASHWMPLPAAPEDV